MKHTLFHCLILLLALLCLSGCSSAVIHDFDDLLPPLIDITTQYPYITSIVVGDVQSNDMVTLTDGVDMDTMRMQFEGIRALRKKADDTETALYTVCFVTTDGNFQIDVISETEFVIDGYYYEAVRFGTDLYYLGSLFGK